jgi:plastocyanin
MAAAILCSCAAPASPAEVRAVGRDSSDQPFAFEPATLKVPVGTVVRWRNDRAVFHTITFSAAETPRVSSGVFDKSIINLGDTVSYSFGAPGTYFYYCSVHADYMFGKVVVTGR